MHQEAIVSEWESGSKTANYVQEDSGRRQRHGAGMLQQPNLCLLVQNEMMMMST